MKKHIKLIAALAAVIALAAFSIACGSDPTATPAPTSTPAPTATPVPPTPTPVPPTPTSEPAETGSAAGLVVTDATLGQDLISMLSTGEQDCIREAYGEAFYNILLQVPLAQGGTDPEAALPLYNCMTTENVLHVGVAFISYFSGGWSEDTITCVSDIVAEHPAIITDAFGITSLPAEPADAVVKHRHLVLMDNCLSTEERAAQFAQNQIFHDSFVTFDSGMLSLLSQPEIDCIQNGLSEEEFAALPEHSLLSAFDSPAGDTLSACIADESFAKSFVVIIEAMLMGSVTDDTRACLTDFAGQHPLYVQAAKLGYYDFAKIPVDEYAELAADGTRVFDCLTDEELLTMQNALIAATLSP